MSAHMYFLFPFNARENTGTFRIQDRLTPDQEYKFFGQIVDMSKRISENPQIPQKPTLDMELLTQREKVIDIDGEEYIPNQNFYLCRAGEFNKLTNIETSYKNQAIIAFLKALDPDSFVVIKMSW